MTAFTLKIIALACMILDHISKAAIFVQGFDAPSWFELVGRIAFPIYAYLIAEGCRRTKSIPKYAVRLFLFALISELPYRLAFSYYVDITQGLSGAAYFGAVIPRALSPLRLTNVLMTLFLGVIAVWIHTKIEKREGRGLYFLSFLAVAALSLLSSYNHSDYEGWGVILIFALYIIKSKKVRIAALFVWIALFYLLYVTFNGSGFMLSVPHYWIQFGFACVALVPIALYNGKRGPGFKYTFYAAYPLHLALIVLIREFVLK